MSLEEKFTAKGYKLDGVEVSVIQDRHLLVKKTTESHGEQVTFELKFTFNEWAKKKNSQS